MHRRLTLSRSLNLGQATQTASNSALRASSPTDGEVRHTKLPDTFDGIRFEIGRMVKYVQDAANDPIVQASADRMCREAGSMGRDSRDPETLSNIRAIEAGCRSIYVYLNDPPNIEFIQTPRRMVKQTQVPPEVILHAIGPVMDAMMDTVGPEAVHGYKPPGITWGDCDEGSAFVLGHCASKQIGPLAFDFGGHEGTLHHVWGKIHLSPNDGDGLAADLTEPDYKLGDYSRFEHYESVEIPL